MSGKDNNRKVLLRDKDLDALIARAAASTMDGQDDRALYERIESRVLNQSLPPQDAQTPRKELAASDGFMRSIDALIDWLNPQHRRLWRPVFAAACPLVLGIVIGNFFHFGLTTKSEPNFESWDDELVMLSFLDISNQGEITEENEGEIR